jgi:protein involved in polysaccharide export with SLBB domain
VAGAVMQPVEIRYQPGKNLNYYIDRAGGYAENARSKRGYVVYANGDVDRKKRYIFGLIKDNPPIEPGAQIIIPPKEERQKMSKGEIISVSATIVSMTTTLLLAIDRLSR